MLDVLIIASLLWVLPGLANLLSFYSGFEWQQYTDIAASSDDKIMLIINSWSYGVNHLVQKFSIRDF